VIETTKKGHKYIKVTQEQMRNELNGIEVCDICYSAIEGKGYLVPSLNSVCCKKCFSRWEQSARTKNINEEESKYESERIKYFLKQLQQ